MKKMYFIPALLLGVITTYASNASTVSFATNSISKNDLKPRAIVNNVFEINQIPSTDFERSRLRQVQRKFDHATTGLYLPAGKSLNLTLENVVAATDGAIPTIVIGTRVKDGADVTEIPLKPGVNTISASQHKGGVIYLRYVSEKGNTNGKIKVTFDTTSEFITHPYYELGVTDEADFRSQIDNSTINDVMFKSKDVIVVANKDKVQQYLLPATYNGKPVSISSWLKSFDAILEAEDYISGLDVNDPNPLHRPMNPGSKFLMCQVTTGYMYATDWATGFNGNDAAAMVRLLTEDQLVNNTWGIAHEIGHQHQQGAYKPGVWTETTVNFYTFAAVRNFLGADWKKWPENIWVDKFHNDWFQRSTRNYWDDNDIKTVYQNQNESRLFFLDQLRVLFGDNLVKTLHRITREEKIDGADDEERKFYFMQKVIQITGYDLRTLYDKWGLVLIPYLKQKLDNMVNSGKYEVPKCNETLHLVTPYNNPCADLVLPMPLIGIKTSTPPVDLMPTDLVASRNAYCDYGTSTGSITDPRDGKVYRYKTYGQKDWFVENLNWNGYDGTNATTQNTVGVAIPSDPSGDAFGRYYPTNQASAAKNWCPSGWLPATKGDFDNLIIQIKADYGVTDSTLGTVMKCGEDRDNVQNGLWAPGAGSISPNLSASLGFNALPAGIYNKDLNAYDSGDAPGLKASFLIPSSTFFHEVLVSGTDAVTYPNRNSKHNASIRCVRPASTLSTVNSDATKGVKFFPNPVTDMLNVSGASSNFTFKIYSVSGNLVKTGKANASPSVIDVRALPVGMYVLEGNFGNETKTFKFIKK